MNPQNPHWTHKEFDIFDDLKSRKNQTHKTVGGDKSGRVVGGYTFNELGFRGDELETYFSSKSKLLTFGCSHTLGVGVGNEETWPHLLANKIQHSHINCGIQGISNDTISRAVLSYTEILKPDLIVVLYTYPHRREYTTLDGRKCSFKPDGKWDYWETDDGLLAHDSLVNLQNDEYDNDNLYRNQLLIKNYLENKGIRLLTNVIDEYLGCWEDEAVDGNHAGVLSNELFTKNLYERYL